MGGPGLQLGEAAVAGEPGGVAHELAEPVVVGVLVLLETGRKNDAGPHAADDARQLEGVGGFHFEVSIAVELDEFNRGAEQLGGLFRLGGTLLRRAVGASLAA